MFCGSIIVIVGLVVLASQDVSGQLNFSSSSSVGASSKLPTNQPITTPLAPTSSPAHPPTTTSSPEKTCFTLNFMLTPEPLNKDLKLIWTSIMSLVERLFGSSAKLSEQNLTIQNTTQRSYVKGEAHVHFNVKKEDQLLEDVFLEWIEKNGTFQNLEFKKDSVSFKECNVTFMNWKAKDGECSKCSGGGGGPIVIKGACVPKKGYSCKGLNSTKEQESKDCVKYCDDSSAVSVAISSFVLTMGILLSFSFNIWK